MAKGQVVPILIMVIGAVLSVPTGGCGARRGALRIISWERMVPPRGY